MKKLISREEAAKRLFEADRKRGRLDSDETFEEDYEIYLKEADCYIRDYLSGNDELGLTIEIKWFEEE